MIAPDMATMLAYRLYRCGVAGRGAAAAARRRRQTGPSIASPSTAIPRPATRVLLCATQQAAHPPVTEPHRSAAQGFSPRARRGDDRSRLAGRPRRRGGAEIRHDRGDRRRERSRRPAASASPIGNSPLVKTALSAGDANWGRIVMAVGKAGEKADPRPVGDLHRRRPDRSPGGPVPGYDESAGRRAYEGPRDHDRRRCRRRPRQGDGVDLRPDPRLYRHQCQLPQLTAPCDRARRGGGARRRRWPRAARPAAGGQIDGRPLGVSRRQGRCRRDAGGGVDPRTRRGARHRRDGELPRAVYLRLPHLPRFPPVDAALCLPQMVGDSGSARRAAPRLGAPAPGSATIRCRRPTSRSSRCCATCCEALVVIRPASAPRASRTSTPS